MPRVLTYTEGKTEASNNGEDVEVRRSQIKTVACRKRYTEELGKPPRLLFKFNHEDGIQTLRHRKGKP
jgi:hypothetical protein